MVKLVISAMEKLKPKDVTEEELNTIIVLAEELVNKRPLGALSESGAPRILRAVDFLRAGYAPDLDWENIRIPIATPASAQAWEKLMQLKRQFFEDYCREVRPFREARQKWEEGDAQPFMGQLVLSLEHDLLPDGSWPVARIVGVDNQDPGKIRQVEVLLNGHHYLRDVRTLAPLFAEEQPGERLQ